MKESKIEDLSELQLKVLGFDHSNQVEQSQAIVIAIKNELIRRQKEAAESQEKAIVTEDPISD